MADDGDAVVTFPPRRARCIRLVCEATRDWLVIALEHGWHGDRRAALADARWLARNLRLPIRETGNRSRP